MTVWCASPPPPTRGVPLPLQGSTKLPHAYGLKYPETYNTKMKKFVFFLILNVLADHRPKSLE